MSKPEDREGAVVIDFDPKETRKLNVMGGLMTGASVFVILFGAYLSFFDTLFSIFFSPFWFYLIGGIGFAFFGSIWIAIQNKLNKESQIALVVSDEGFIDHSSGIAAGFIAWEEVERLDVKGTFGQQFIRVEVRDPEKFMQRASFFR